MLHNAALCILDSELTTISSTDWASRHHHTSSHTLRGENHTCRFLFSALHKDTAVATEKTKELISRPTLMSIPRVFGSSLSLFVSSVSSSFSAAIQPWKTDFQSFLWTVDVDVSATWTLKHWCWPQSQALAIDDFCGWELMNFSSRQKAACDEWTSADLYVGFWLSPDTALHNNFTGSTGFNLRNEFLQKRLRESLSIIANHTHTTLLALANRQFRVCRVTSCIF